MCGSATITSNCSAMRCLSLGALETNTTTCALDIFEEVASCFQDEQNAIESLLKSRASPDVIKTILQEIHDLLDGLIVRKRDPELRCAGDKRRSTVLVKRNTFSRQATMFSKCACEYLNAYVRKSGNSDRL